MEETLRGSGESNPSSAFGPAAFPDRSFHGVSSCWKSACPGPGSALLCGTLGPCGWGPWASLCREIALDGWQRAPRWHLGVPCCTVMSLGGGGPAVCSLPTGEETELGLGGQQGVWGGLAGVGGVPTTGSLSDLAGAHKQASETQASLAAVLLL